MTGTDYMALAARTVNKDLTIKSLELHALHGMVGEIGEIHSLYQKVYQGHRLDTTHLSKELGDLMWFISEFCLATGLNLDDVMEQNIAKLKARYPEGFSTDKSLHRKEGDI